MFRQGRPFRHIHCHFNEAATTQSLSLVRQAAPGHVSLPRWRAALHRAVLTSLKDHQEKNKNRLSTEEKKNAFGAELCSSFLMWPLLEHPSCTPFSSSHRFAANFLGFFFLFSRLPLSLGLQMAACSRCFLLSSQLKRR